MALDLGKKTAQDLQEEDEAHTKTDLSAKAYDVNKILGTFVSEAEALVAAEPVTPYEAGGSQGLNPLQKASVAIDEMYTTAPDCGKTRRS